jgi:hypothetical protein
MDSTCGITINSFEIEDPTIQGKRASSKKLILAAYLGSQTGTA